MPGVYPTAVEWRFELPLVVDHKPEIWLQGTIDCVQEFPRPIIDWKNPGSKPPHRVGKETVVRTGCRLHMGRSITG